MIWQADFYRIPLQNDKEEILWQLLSNPSRISL
ncbi:MAG: Tab2/Atab2 family RNA-binding protein [Dolichospermum sp.]